MKTIKKSELELEDLTDVVLIVREIDSDIAYLYTADDDEGKKEQLKTGKSYALHQMNLAQKEKDIALDKNENKYLREAVLVGLGHRGKSPVQAQQEYKALIESKMAIESDRETKQAEIIAATTLEELELITW